jgi:O-antigen/teichoic acid export membrane protein
MRTNRIPDYSSRKVASGTANVAIASAVGQAVTAAGFLFLARRTESTQLGVFGAGYALSTFAAAAIDFGSSTAETRRLATAKHLDGFGRWMVRRTAISIIPTSAVWLVLAVTTKSLVGWIGVSLLALQTLSMVAAAGVLAATRAIRSPAEASWLVAAGNVLFLVGSISPIGAPLTSAAAGAAASWLLTGLMAIRLLRRSGFGEWLGKSRDVANPWAGASGFGVFALAANASALLVPIAAATAGGYEAGQLAAVNRWVQPAMLLPLSYSAYMFPKWSREPSFDLVARSLRKAWPLLAASFAAVFALAVAAPFLVDLLIGEAYGGAVAVLRLLSLATLPAIIVQPLNSALQAQGDEKFVAALGVISAGLMLLIAALLSQRLGATAAAIASGLAAAVTLLALARRCFALVRSAAQAR